jgi:hypothetical protein
MACFAVKYQLNEAKDYPPLWEEMTRLGGHKVLRSFYFLDLNTTAEILRNHLKNFIDDDDAVVVVPFSSRPFTRKAFQGTQAWIDARF